VDAHRWSNLLAVRQSYESGSVITAPGPLEAFFEVAARCNLHCQMCAINFDSRYLPGSKRPPFLTPELFHRLEPIFPTLLRAYLFGLGEPLLNKHLVDYVAALSAAGVEVWFNTNATLIDDEKAEALARAGAGAITVSIDGATPETYERIRVGAQHAAVVRGIRSLVRAAGIYGVPKVDLSFVGMASNLHELPMLVDFASEVGARGVHVEPLYSQIQHDLQEHYARENLGILGSETVDRHFQDAKKRADERGIRLVSRFLVEGGSADYVERARSANIWWTCNEPWTSIWVTSAGEVRTCCINETSFGNLFEQPFSDIWNGAAFRGFRDQHRLRQDTPVGCANCIRNGRVRHSPYLAALQPVTYRPLKDPAGANPSAETLSATLEWPSDGVVVTDPLAVRGRLARGENPPDLVIDRDVSIPLSQAAVWESGEYAAVLEVPFLSEGAHLLSLRRGDGEEFAVRTVHVWRPPREAARIPATSSLAIGISCSRDARGARLSIDGRRWKAGTWLYRRSPEGCRGIAWFDLEGLPPGPHDLSVKPGRHRRSRHAFVKLPSAGN
jgi:MoaA/NifB/PqqE/SkfB family radical SAM enzyme